MSGGGVPLTGAAGLHAALETSIVVEEGVLGYRVWLQWGSYGRIPVGAPRPTRAVAERDAHALHNMVFAIARPFLNDRGLACGCTSTDPVLCCDLALERCGLELPRRPVRCRCRTCHGDPGGAA